MMFKAAVVTVSDRSFRGERPDGGGPLVAEILKSAGYEVIRTAIVPDEQPQIQQILTEIADSGAAELIVTTGGTGFAPRDVTPEAQSRSADRVPMKSAGSSHFPPQIHRGKPDVLK